MKEFLSTYQMVLLVAGAWLALVFLLLWLLTRVDYSVGPKHLRITLLGIPVRRVRLDNIKYIGRHATVFAEKWHNQLFPSNSRRLVIRKKRGWVKTVVITPEQPYVLKAEIDRAVVNLLAREGPPPPRSRTIPSGSRVRS